MSISAITACKSGSRSSAAAENAEEILNELDAPASLLLESAKNLKPLPFVDTLADGSIVLSEQEKLVKPAYLLNPETASNCVTLKQKYVHIGLLSVDKAVASLYDMPVDLYNKALNSLLVDCSDPALTIFLTASASPSERAEAFPALVEAEYQQGRDALFWAASSAVAVEQLYVITRNIDKFLLMFSDEDVAAFSANLATVHDGIVDTVNRHSEMSDLNNALCPLYAIDATTVRQLKFQLKNLEGDIFSVRKYLLNYK